MKGDSITRGEKEMGGNGKTRLPKHCGRGGKRKSIPPWPNKETGPGDRPEMEPGTKAHNDQNLGSGLGHGLVDCRRTAGREEKKHAGSKNEYGT